MKPVSPIADAHRLDFPKSERLHSDVLIQVLHSQGTSFLKHPLRIVFLRIRLSWYLGEPADRWQVVITAPKKHFKRAHDRNLLKRRIKEAYRLHKPQMPTTPSDRAGVFHLMAISYIAKEVLPYAQIERKWLQALEQMADFSQTPIVELAERPLISLKKRSRSSLSTRKS